MSKESKKAWYEKNKERHLANNKKWKTENKERVLELNRIHKAKRSTKISVHEYYVKNKTAIIDKNKQWQIDNPERFKAIVKKAVKAYRKTPKGIYRDIKQNAMRRGREIMDRDIFIAWYESQLKICVYCGVDENGHGARMSIDRMDNGKGYVEGNLCLACNVCNGVKSNLLTHDEMLFVGKNVIAKR